MFLKFFECFCPFLSLTIFAGQGNFLSPADGLHDRTQETKSCFKHFFFTAKCENFFLNFEICFLCELITNNARKLEVA